MIRAAFIVVSALSAGFAVGKTLLSREVEKRKTSAIEFAGEEARRRVRDQADIYLKASVRAYAIATLIKAGLLVLAWSGLIFEVYSAAVFNWIVFGLLVTYVMRDAVVSWPTVRLAVREIRQHGWKPKRAIGEIVAARVFEQVLDEVQAEKTTRSGRILLRLAGENHGEVTLQIARAVAEIAKEATWDDLKPFLFAAGAKVFILLSLYSGLVWLILHF